MERKFFDLNLDLNASSETPTSGNSVNGGVLQYRKEAPSLQVKEDMQKKSVVHDFLPASTFYPLSSANSFDFTSKNPSSLSKNMPIMMWNIGSLTTPRNTLSHDHDARVATKRPRTTSDSTTVYPMSLEGISSAMEKPAFFGSASLNNICFFNKPADNFRENTKASQPLKILHGNDVRIYDEISPHKAESIMSIAKNAASGTSTADTNLARDKPFVSDDATGDKQLAITGSKRICLITASQARKASLDRFLERRKGRMLIGVLGRTGYA